MKKILFACLLLSSCSNKSVFVWTFSDVLSLICLAAVILFFLFLGSLIAIGKIKERWQQRQRFLNQKKERQKDLGK